VSRRSKRRRDSLAAGEEGTGGTRPAARRSAGEEGTAGTRPAARRAAPGGPLGVQIAFLAVVFGVVVLVAELAGAANLGVALGVGQIAFALAVVYLLVRR
jgi:hypothetical protein